MARDAIRITPDVFVPGGGVFLGAPPAGRAPLAALSVVRESGCDLRAARRACLSDMLDRMLRRAGPDARLRLLVAWPAWEPDRPTARTRSIFRWLKENAASSPLADWTEVVHAEGAGLKYFAEVGFAREAVDDVESVLFQSAHSALVLAPSHRPLLHRFLGEGWGFRTVPRHPYEEVGGRWVDVFLRETALIASSAGCVLFRVDGAFDDRVARASAVGLAEDLGLDETGRSRRDDSR